jgi:hypothetical protein
MKAEERKTLRRSVSIAKVSIEDKEWRLADMPFDAPGSWQLVKEIALSKRVLAEWHRKLSRRPVQRS